MSDWTWGFISGLVATLIGFILTILWESHKANREKRDKDKVIKRLIIDVLTENLQIIAEIKEHLQAELQVIDQKLSNVTNMTILYEDIWDLIKFNIPSDLLKEDGLLKRLQSISGKIKRINESIHSRENYRLVLS